MKSARALVVALSPVICAILAMADLAEGRSGGSFGSGGFHGGSIGNHAAVTGGYGYPYGYGGGYLNYGGVTNPTPETSNPLGSGGGPTYEVYGPRESGAETAPTQVADPLGPDDTRGAVAPEDVLDQGGPGDPLTGHLNDDWWEVGASAQSASAEGPAVGTTVAKLPIGYKSGTVGDREFFYREGVFYAAAPSGFEVIAPPIGATVTTIPGRAQLETVDHQQYFDLEGVYYQAFYGSRGLVYKVVEDPHR